MENFLIQGLLMVFAFVITFFITKFLIIRLKLLGLVSIDLHKEHKPKRPKLGGISIALGFTLSTALAYIFYESVLFLLVLISFLISANIGLLDDFVRFEKVGKLILPSLAAIPLLLLIPLEIGTILLLFVAIGVVSNWTNMLAGFNGLEIGLGCIAVFFLALNTTTNASILLLIYSACLLAFLYFNKYPAKIFPGDVGTLPIGTVFVASYLLGAPIIVITILLIPYFVDAMLKFFSAGIISSGTFPPTQVNSSGVLVPQENYLSLATVIIKLWGDLQEWQLVALLWIFEIVLGIATLVLL